MVIQETMRLFPPIWALIRIAAADDEIEGHKIKAGDKIGAKLIAEEVGVPVAPWSRGPVATLQDALRAGDEIGYPLMLKATAGGGGRGIRKVEGPDELTEAYSAPATRRNARSARAWCFWRSWSPVPGTSRCR